MAYLPLSTANLPDPAINPAQGSSPADHFVAVTYAGNGGSQTVPTGLAPDLLWIKQRNGADWHHLFDELRGHDVALYSNETVAEGAKGFNMSLNADSFSMNTSNTAVNGSSGTYVAWNWKANGSGVSNTDGSITSTVSANTESGFSIATFTGTGATSETVGHGLNSTPELVIAKRRDNVSDWFVYSKEFPDASYYMYLNSTAAQAVYNPFWNSTAPTSDVFTVGSIFGSGGTYVAYCFHSVEGFSKCSSYVGNGSADGSFIYTGFRPSFLIIKATGLNEGWIMYDTKRNSYNLSSTVITAEEASGDATNAVYGIDILSNGFKCRYNWNGVNGSGQKYIYMAFAENPFKFSLAR